MREVSTASDDAPILVVDDDPKILQLVRMYLEREGFAVITVADGLAAVAAIRDRAPRLVVRVKALLRRAEPRERPRPKLLSLGDLAIDLDRHEVRRNGKRIALTQSE